MFINNFDPVAFQIFSLEIRWYSLSYIFGLIFGWFYCKKFLIKDEKILNLFDDLITYLIIGIIVGGRLGYVLIYNFDYYIKNLNEIFCFRLKQFKVNKKYDQFHPVIVFTSKYSSKPHGPPSRPFPDCL